MRRREMPTMTAGRAIGPAIGLYRVRVAIGTTEQESGAGEQPRVSPAMEEIKKEPPIKINTEETKGTKLVLEMNCAEGKPEFYKQMVSTLREVTKGPVKVPGKHEDKKLYNTVLIKLKGPNKTREVAIDVANNYTITKIGSSDMTAKKYNYPKLETVKLTSQALISLADGGNAEATEADKVTAIGLFAEVPRSKMVGTFVDLSWWNDDGFPKVGSLATIGQLTVHEYDALVHNFGSVWTTIHPEDKDEIKRAYPPLKKEDYSTWVTKQKEEAKMKETGIPPAVETIETAVAKAD